MKKTIIAPIIMLLASGTVATAATIVIPVSEGSISFSQTVTSNSYGYFQPTFNLNGANGSLTGTTPTGDIGLSGAFMLPVGTHTIDPSLTFFTGSAYSGLGGITDFQLLVPGPVHIYNDGKPSLFDQVSGTLAAAPFNLTVDSSGPFQPITVREAFSGELRMTDYTISWPNPPTLLNEYVFEGQGIAQFNFVGGCNLNGQNCHLDFESATYTFTPEPSATVLLALALSVGGAWFLHHRKSMSTSI